MNLLDLFRQQPMEKRAMDASVFDLGLDSDG